MHEIIAMLIGYLRALWRRRWLAMAIAWLVCLIAWGAVLMLPDRYEASARVYVDAATPLKPVLEGLAVGDDPQSQLLLVREALLSRPHLETVARKTNLDANVTNTSDMDNLILGLQTDIQVTSSSVRGGSADNLYSISYQHTNHQKSVDVVRNLLDSFVADTLSGNRSGADEAQGFLREQIALYEKRLTEAEARLAEFKKRNVGLIPGERGDYFARLDTEMNSLQRAENSLSVAQKRRDALRAQLTSSQPYLPGTSGSASGTSAPIAVSDISLQIQASEARLQELLLRFTEKHPEVVALKSNITELKAREAKELAELSRGGKGTGAIRSLSANPVYQSIQLQMNQVDVEIASLRGTIDQHKNAIAGLRKFVDSAPEVEQEFARLNRDYGVTKTQYEALVKRLEQARVSDDAAKSGVIRFEVIEPPRANVKPVWPKRPMLMIAGLFGGLFAGIAFAALLYFLAPTYHDISGLSASTGLPVLGAVSRVRDPKAVFRTRIDIGRFVLTGGALVATCVFLIVFGVASLRMLHRLVS